MTPDGLTYTNFHFPGQSSSYQGKVRDTYEINNQYLVFITTDRISAFDQILPEPIPYKGEILNQLAARFLTMSQSIVPNWLLEVPDPAVAFGLRCEPLPVEMIVRGYLCGSAWRAYQQGATQLSGEPLPSGMTAYDPFPEPLVTPTTKAQTGHDTPISREQILQDEILSEAVYDQLTTYSRQLFEQGQAHAQQQGLILADTKYEFGLYKGQVYLIDEVHTPDSSRYFYQDGFQELVKAGKAPRQLSKEFVREWLMTEGFTGEPGQSLPLMDKERIETIQQRYLELYEQLTGEAFSFSDRSNVHDRIANNVAYTIDRYQSDEAS
jgi:phosphoribosylaminoimidazole-succinocarboxamide synthase